MVLQVDNVVKRFGPQLAVGGISFEVRAGEVFALVGPNGAGKSTTIRMILGILLPDEGSIWCDGERVTELPKSAVGYLPEQRGMYLDLTPRQMLEFMGGLRGLSAARVRSQTEVWLERFDLQQHLHKKLGALSKGMQQKVQFLMSFMHSPRLLVLDEPLSGLDPVNVALFTEILGELKSTGTAILYSSHNMEQVERLADSVAVVDGGVLKQRGALVDLLRERDRFVCRVDYLGEPCIGESEAWRIRKHDRRVLIEASSEADMKEAARRALGWGPVQRMSLGQMTLQELYLQTVRKAEEIV